jgi:hypothetical protein
MHSGAAVHVRHESQTSCHQIWQTHVLGPQKDTSQHTSLLPYTHLTRTSNEIPANESLAGTQVPDIVINSLMSRATATGIRLNPDAVIGRIEVIPAGPSQAHRPLPTLD